VLVQKDQSAKSDLSTFLTSLGLNQEQINSLEITTISKDQFDKVTALKDRLPFYADNVSIGYDKSLDKTKIHINQKNKTEGEKQLSEYLKQNEIDSTDWINNLSIIYQ